MELNEKFLIRAFKKILNRHIIFPFLQMKVKKKTPSFSRHRPSVIRPLSSSTLAEKYEILPDKKIQLANGLQQERELRMTLLKFNIALKKKQLIAIGFHGTDVTMFTLMQNLRVVEKELIRCPRRAVLDYNMSDEREISAAASSATKRGIYPKESRTIVWKVYSYFKERNKKGNLIDTVIPSKCLVNPLRVRATYDKFESTVNRWFDECDSDNDDLLNKYDDDMNARNIDSEDNENISNHDTDSEVEIDDDVIEDEQQVERIREDENELSDSSESIIQTCLFGKNLFKWTTEPQNTRTRTRKHNIVSQLLGLRGPNRPTKASPENMWNRLIDDTILTKVLHWTNVRIQRERVRYSNNRRSEIKDLDMIELKATLFYCGIQVKS
ncbi:hypothetical protein RN001_007635 [Aquatica leii]|uniref:Uncharacterized protein n=1 Tax=Aquatica leii TaxID=1421715 RepID=A0AAN7P917_9COLE|nr:hypothetical protein RN001_007635 [Aquatica leii]